MIKYLLIFLEQIFSPSVTLCVTPSSLEEGLRAYPQIYTIYIAIYILTFFYHAYIIINILIGNDCIIVVNLSSYRKKESPAESFFKINKLVNFNTGASHFVRD